MENLCKGLLIGMAAGVVVGAVLVVKNKTLRDKVKQGVACAEEKIEEAKDMIAKKIEESENSSNSESQNSQQPSLETAMGKESNFSKKSRK